METPRNVKGISDNSFFVEEAYNQEAGVVQHILATSFDVDRQPGSNDRAVELTFIQEWPLFGMTHQIGFALPYGFSRSGGNDENGLGDMQLDYRYQVYYDEPSLTGFAPRLSVILPTGDEVKGFGEDTVGLDVNLPFSTMVSDDWFVHANAGATWLPNAASAGDRDLTHYNLGLSGIYAATPELHFLLEWIGGWEELPGAGGTRQHEFASIISPGLRKALNYQSGAQLVLGLAVPIGLTGSAPDYGLFFYLSFGHAFRKVEN